MTAAIPISHAEVAASAAAIPIARAKVVGAAAAIPIGRAKVAASAAAISIGRAKVADSGGSDLDRSRQGRRLRRQRSRSVTPRSQAPAAAIPIGRAKVGTKAASDPDRSQGGGEARSRSRKVEDYRIREGSGGKGRFRGGDGGVRRVRFLASMTASIVSNNRVRAPRGAAGGEDGAPGANWVLRKDGRVERLAGCDRVQMAPGDVFVTPGAGGYGAP